MSSDEIHMMRHTSGKIREGVHKPQGRGAQTIGKGRTNHREGVRKLKTVSQFYKTVSQFYKFMAQFYKTATQF